MMNKYASCEFYSRFFYPALTIKGHVTSFLVYLVHTPYSSQSNLTLDIFGIFDSLYKALIKQVEKLYKVYILTHIVQKTFMCTMRGS